MEEADESIMSAAAPAADEAAAPMLDGQLMAALADGKLPEQLAGATAALQEQCACHSLPRTPARRRVDR